MNLFNSSYIISSHIVDIFGVKRNSSSEGLDTLIFECPICQRGGNHDVLFYHKDFPTENLSVAEFHKEEGIVGNILKCVDCKSEFEILVPYHNENRVEIVLERRGKRQIEISKMFNIDPSVSKIFSRFKGKNNE